MISLINYMYIEVNSGWLLQFNRILSRFNPVTMQTGANFEPLSSKER